MMETPLNSWLLFDHAPLHAPEAEVVSRTPSGDVERHTYAAFGRRTQQLMHALDHLDLPPGCRVATLAWNSGRHLEAYFAVPCTGRVLHTLNVRVSPEELAYMLGDADDRAVLVDPDLLPQLEQALALVSPSAPIRVIVLADRVPDTSIAGAIAYEDLLADESTSYPRREIDEREPMGLCYTSGTTGRPKGVLYTHRSTFLHALAVTSHAAMSIGPGDAVLPQVPMFHANAWGMPYAAAAVGAKQVFFAGALEASDFVDLLVAERVTVAAGVPTVWLGIADELARRGESLPEMRHIICGGAQPPRALIERYESEFGLHIVQAWGMTETSPLASVAWPQEHMRDWSPEEITSAARTRAGLPLPGVEISIRDETDTEVPADGTSMGDLLVRGPWVVDGYLHGQGTENFTDDGWFKTGDVAVSSAGGYFVIADRTKDLIKSGGEWISSVDMEAMVMQMEQVVEAAVIAVPDPKWQERPLVCVVLKDGAVVSSDDVREHLLAGGFAKWQLPERIEVIDSVPRTTVGKFDKKVLRAQFG
jgi:acyl-CoA synthetase (AMP-forming)/AMP-acid ligase II